LLCLWSERILACLFALGDRSFLFVRCREGFPGPPRFLPIPPCPPPVRPPPVTTNENSTDDGAAMRSVMQLRPIVNASPDRLRVYAMAVCCPHGRILFIMSTHDEHFPSHRRKNRPMIRGGDAIIRLLNWWVIHSHIQLVGESIAY
jgi:hypothetical protein